MSHDPNDPLAPFRREQQPASPDQARDTLTERQDALVRQLNDFADVVEAYLVHGDVNLPLWIAEARKQAAIAYGDKQEVAHQEAVIAKVSGQETPNLLEENEQLKAINAELLEALKSLMDTWECNPDHYAEEIETYSPLIAKAMPELAHQAEQKNTSQGITPATGQVREVDIEPEP